MELGEGEAQICRLCGQYESIYIDVFSEEGTKRLLGLKIHSKINILIDERDPLPKAICVQCLGKLEFVCDFQEECLRTQQVLRDRYNLPPLTEIAEVKTEETAPSTSTNNNNNDIDKNLNPPAKESIKEVAQRVSKTTAKTQRNLRSQHQANSHSNGSSSSSSNSNINSNSNGNSIGTEVAKGQTTAESITEDITDSIEIVQSAETTPTRWLRSRQNTEIILTNETTTDTPIANRLRSHCNTAAEISVSSNVSETSGKQQDPNTIQIPTSALNKLLTIVSNSPNIEVSAKESKNQSNDTEDISFTVELCKKESDDVATVRARVFPDQGSCLVDESIVGLLQNQSCVEVNSIINTIISSSLKNGSSTKSKDSAEFEQKWQASQNPEELFKIDGEEIRVDDNMEHIVTDNQNGYSCKLCCKFYERKDKCMVHVKTHLGIKQYTCILCNAKFVCKSDVMKHIRCSHTNPRPIQCPKCPKRFKSKFYLMEHDNVHKGVRPYSCTDCGQSYHHKVSLQIHMKSHLPPQNLACEYCGKVFPYRTRLLSHIASVHLKNRRNFRCRFCYNLYSSLSVLNEHIKTRHATTYTCEVCSKTFKVASKYKAHVLQHTNPKPFVCNVCNNRYASKAFLNEHLLKHEGLRKHICQKCGARFAQASHLAAHRHVHGEKKHACPECGRKFNRRDNMKIKENDGLPHVVCLRCIGALEFLCDFYSCCQLTQKKLSFSEDASKYSSENTPRRISQHENDAEYNKENVLPSSNETKRRSKVSSSGKKDRPTNDARPDAQTILQGNTLDDRKQSATNNAIVQEQKSKGEQISNDNALSCGSPMLIKDISKKGIVRANGSEFLNRRVFSTKNGEANEKIALAQPKGRVRGRKTQLQKLREAGLSLNIKRKSQKGLDEMERDGNNSRKRQCLGTICANGTSNVTKNAVILSKPQIELPLEEKIATISPSKHDIKNNDANNDFNGGIVEVNLKDESLNVEIKEDSFTKSKAISVIVKQEKVEVEEISQESGKPNQLVWIPNEILSEGQTLDTMHNQDQESELDLSLQLSPEREYDRENSEIAVTTHTDSSDSNDSNYSNDSNDSDDSEQPKTNLLFEKQTRATVIRSSRESPVVVKSDVTNHIDGIDGIKNDSKCDLQFSQSLQDRNSSGSEETKNKDRSFAKISELISEEQKEEIESYYRIDMSIVNSEEVQKNMTVVDKKNIRCNICGSLYLRMDKCQVHIWGHLQMKPFQCKACDFATVTVSNVRCHIRKSHLKIKPFACDLCGKRYVTAGLLEQHMNSHTGARPFKCKLCDFASSTRQMLSYHSSTHKPIKDINCKICGAEFYSRSKLRTHMIVHKGDKVVVCKLCSAHLSNAEALETHHKNLHMQDYVCNVCGKHMKSKKALHNHQNVHSTGKYKCTLCTNVYKSSQILKEHLLKHEGIRKYKCNVCGKTFGQQSHLAAHMAVHSGIRFHCPGCDKSFNRHDNMKIHTKRCKLFLANPELKNLLIKKERSSSISKVIKSTEDTTSKDSLSLKFESFFEKQTADNEEISMKTVDDKEETAMKLGLNISCIESPDKMWTCDNVRYQEVGELTGSAELCPIQIAETNDTFVLENENVRILEIL